ncbi:MAG TPA: hypothetical protein VFV57_05830 [Limnobacter sp.]|nr:hypothetical protein [Limnobacter sp.]
MTCIRCCANLLASAVNPAHQHAMLAVIDKAPGSPGRDKVLEYVRQSKTKQP